MGDDLTDEMVEIAAIAADRHFDAIMTAKGHPLPSWEDATPDYRRNATAAMRAGLTALRDAGWAIVRAAHDTPEWEAMVERAARAIAAAEADYGDLAPVLFANAALTAALTPDAEE